ncbi:alpha/beta fold hydrolase [Actinoplanes sp. NPDC049265]|uniref:alpha/beta fold hydrolase n=1 Tax=Actinoplanes sp. NPDC049265 TaxID=3363902 RepID=UPI003715BF44
MATFTTGDGVDLHYTDDGDGPPVLLLAGFCGPAESWEFQRRALIDAGHRVIALDRRSHGRSADPPLRALLRDHAAQDWRDVVARLSVPSLFLAPRDSQLWPAGHAAWAASVNERAGVVTLDGCGHAMAVDQPEAVSAAIVEFLR